MSRHTITIAFGKPNRTRTIVAGFDRQSKQCFVQIIRNNDGIPFETHQLDIDIWNGDAALLEQAFKNRRMNVPLKFFEQVGWDAHNLVGNRIVQWNPDGTIKHEYLPKDSD
jgi:hypothetical protein